MDEDIECLIAALERVARCDAKIRHLAARRRFEHADRRLHQGAVANWACDVRPREEFSAS